MRIIIVYICLMQVVLSRCEQLPQKKYTEEITSSGNFQTDDKCKNAANLSSESKLKLLIQESANIIPTNGVNFCKKFHFPTFNSLVHSFAECLSVEEQYLESFAQQSFFTLYHYLCKNNGSNLNAFFAQMDLKNSCAIMLRNSQDTLLSIKTCVEEKEKLWNLNKDKLLKHELCLSMTIWNYCAQNTISDYCPGEQEFKNWTVGFFEAAFVPCDGVIASVASVDLFGNPNQGFSFGGGAFGGLDGNTANPAAFIGEKCAGVDYSSLDPASLTTNLQELQISALRIVAAFENNDTTAFCNEQYKLPEQIRSLTEIVEPCLKSDEQYLVDLSPDMLKGGFSYLCKDNGAAFKQLIQETKSSTSCMNKIGKIEEAVKESKACNEQVGSSLKEDLRKENFCNVLNQTAICASEVINRYCADDAKAQIFYTELSAAFLTPCSAYSVMVSSFLILYSFILVKFIS